MKQITLSTLLFFSLLALLGAATPLPDGWQTMSSVVSSKSPRQNCEEYAPLLLEVARQKADLVVLVKPSPPTWAISIR